MSSAMTPPMGRDVLKETRSPLNGPDVALGIKSGEMNPQGTFGEMMESSFGIKWEDPLPVAMEKMKGAARNSTPEGKMKSIAGGPANQVPGMPQRPQPAGRPMAAQGGLESLMGGR